MTEGKMLFAPRFCILAALLFYGCGQSRETIDAAGSPRDASTVLRDTAGALHIAAVLGEVFGRVTLTQGRPGPTLCSADSVCVPVAPLDLGDSRAALEATLSGEGCLRTGWTGGEAGDIVVEVRGCTVGASEPFDGKFYVRLGSGELSGAVVVRFENVWLDDRQIAGTLLFIRPGGALSQMDADLRVGHGRSELRLALAGAFVAIFDGATLLDGAGALVDRDGAKWGLALRGLEQWSTDCFPRAGEVTLVPVGDPVRFTFGRTATALFSAEWTDPQGEPKLTVLPACRCPAASPARICRR